MKTIVIGAGGAVHAAGEVVELLAESGIVDGTVLLSLNAGMALHEVAALPEPWVPGAYAWRDGQFEHLPQSEAWQSHLSGQAEQFAALVKQYDAEVQGELDRVARSFLYDSMATAVTYASEPAVAKFQAEGRLLRAWRSRYWAACWPILEAVRAGQRPVPDVADLLAELNDAAPPPTAQNVQDEIAALSA